MTSRPLEVYRSIIYNENDYMIFQKAYMGLPIAKTIAHEILQREHPYGKAVIFRIQESTSKDGSPVFIQTRILTRDGIGSAWETEAARIKRLNG